MTGVKVLSCRGSWKDLLGEWTQRIVDIAGLFVGD